MSADQLYRPRWVRDLTDDAMLREEIAPYGPDAFFVVSPYATPTGEALDEYWHTPGFRTYTENDDGDLETTPEMRYLMAGIIGTHNIGSTSGGVVVPIRDGIDLPMPSGQYIVRIENDYGADLFTVARIHIVDGEEVTEGKTDADLTAVGELVHRAGCYVNWDETEWINTSIS
jgi:hypothetical protein